MSGSGVNQLACGLKCPWVEAQIRPPLAQTHSATPAAQVEPLRLAKGPVLAGAQPQEPKWGGSPQAPTLHQAKVIKPSTLKWGKVVGFVQVVKGTLPNMYCLEHLWVLATPNRGSGVTNY